MPGFNWGMPGVFISEKLRERVVRLHPIDTARRGRALKAVSPTSSAQRSGARSIGNPFTLALNRSYGLAPNGIAACIQGIFP